MPKITEPTDGKKLTEYLDTGKFKKVLLPFWHGVGDVVMFMPLLKYLREKYPDIKIDIGLAKGLQEEFIIEDAVLLDGDWREKSGDTDYDLVFPCNMPLERLDDLSMTKAEICCQEELGIPKICGHLPVKRKRLIGVHFHNTSVSWLANPDKETAKMIWEEIREANCVPVETLFQHVFYNKTSERFDFVDNHVRGWPANLDSLISLIGALDGLIAVASGNFHLGLSILGAEKVMFLQKEIKAEHFTKEKISVCDIKNFKKGKVVEWLARIS